ncbi:type I-G CRISPR-associated RAMP protein Csb1/Cas7g [Nocardia camponoti]|uniref:Type I-U CRISPR-associated protein Cas7 n=1 Tax=Nocardia camponoti TaxID=1616106 RepID=A0A917VDU0_9NOCA|nr:type I-U CRISPR-associated RAMP protein Csb1/Cas7u [Nocardia camponoti]GGK64870.1 hypothetical protein GCM10011591_41430 [Nocardia camponoti]
MVQALKLTDLIEAVSAGGASCLTSTTELRPAAGEHASVAPAKYAGATKRGTYAYEVRYEDGEPRDVVLIDAKQSQLNRIESVLRSAMRDGHETLSRLPHLTVTYQQGDTTVELTDLELPHRAFDGHFRAGTIDGEPATKNQQYVSVRDAQPGNARALLDASPVSLIFGAWDSSRAARQGRWRSILVGEIIGFCAAPGDKEILKGGARIDPLGAKIELTSPQLKALAERQKSELSAATFTNIANGKQASRAGLGAIPPTLEALAGVACRRIVRSHVLSFAALRQIRFAAGAEGDAACGALLAALALNGLARSDAELTLRANCDLAEAGPTTVSIQGRGGTVSEYQSLSIDAADQLLAEALAHAEKVADVKWSGEVLRIVGDPAIASVAGEDSGAE